MKKYFLFIFFNNQKDKLIYRENKNKFLEKNFLINKNE